MKLIDIFQLLSELTFYSDLEKDFQLQEISKNNFDIIYNNRHQYYTSDKISVLKFFDILSPDKLVISKSNKSFTFYIPPNFSEIVAQLKEDDSYFILKYGKFEFLKNNLDILLEFKEISNMMEKLVNGY